MRRSHRRAHLLLWIILAPLAAGLLALAIATRAEVPRVPAGTLLEGRAD